MYIKPELPGGESKTQHKDIMVYTHSVLWHFFMSILEVLHPPHMFGSF